MRRPFKLFPAAWLGALALAGNFPAAALPSDWQHEQHFDVPELGLKKFSLPVDTLDAARPALEDLRLFDDAGNELPYVIEHPRPAVRIVQAAKSFQTSLNPGATVLTLETGLAQALDAVTLETPALNFIKAVRVEGSGDGNRWQPLAQGRPVFRQPNGASALQIAFPAGTWRWLRLTVEDQRSPPVPFTGARVQAAAGESAPGEWLPLPISERHDNPGETRLTLNLGAANLDLAALQIETAEPLFTRPVTVAEPQIVDGAIREQTVAQGVIFRVAVEGLPASTNLMIPVENQIRSRELVLLVKNQDSPPLTIPAVRAERRPVYLAFLARSAGAHHLLTGNRQCAAPSYDLAALGANLKRVSVSPVTLSPLADNPNYRAPEALPGIQTDGAALEVASWKFRKPVTLTRAGAQQLELDLDTLAHAQPGFDDLRLLRGGKQVPYILERTSISRALSPEVTVTTDAKDKKLSRWILKLPKANLPLTRLSCVTRTALFERELTVTEEVADERGEKYRRNLGRANWTRTPDRSAREFVLALESAPQTDTLFLETPNGDNPAIELDQFQFFYPATRVLFKAEATDAVRLYYGNSQVTPPRYDLSLVAGQLLAADKASATLGAEEGLKKGAWGEGQIPGQGGLVFWGILAFVVVVLLVIISRLLPKSESPTNAK